MAPYLFAGLADLLRDDASLLDAVAAAYPARHVSWTGTTVTVARTAFGQPIAVHPARAHPDGRGLVTFTIDITGADTADDRTVEKLFRRITAAALDLAAAVRPMLLVLPVEVAVDELLDAPADLAGALFGWGWADVERMDERRAAGFRRALAGTGHREVAGGIHWSGASEQTAAQLRAAWVRDREPPGRPHHRHG